PDTYSKSAIMGSRLPYKYLLKTQALLRLVPLIPLEKISFKSIYEVPSTNLQVGRTPGPSSRFGVF
ncbi:MAG: hypothetical protein V3V92_02655, partial [Candidatus Hydrothermarchaeales archaeon]